MRLAILLAAALLLAGCAASSPERTTVTVTKTATPSGEPERAPSVTFSKSSDPSKQGGVLTVVAVHGGPRDGILWSDLRVEDDQGARRCTLPAGMVDAGDTVPCSTDGPHTITHLPSDTVLYRAEF